MSGELIVIDGGMLEGGGQILRNAVALSCLTKTPITVNNIRAGRNNPGLRPQHLSGIFLVNNICGGALQGGNVGSTEITFVPKDIRGGNYTADTKTAGSTCLLVQAALPCQLFGNGPSQLVLCGGTNAEMAPQIDYFTWVLQPIVAKFGVNFDCKIIKRGYYPKGGGKISLTTQPVKHLSPVELTNRGDVVSITGRAFVAGVLPIKVARAMASSARSTLQEQYGSIPINIEALKEPDHLAVGTGTGIIITAETSTGCLIAGSALGKRGVPAEEVGYKAAEELLRNLQHGGCVDEHLQDQLIILMALAGGTSRILCGPITLHTQTAIEIAKMLTSAKFNIKQISQEQHIIECEGVGMVNNNL